MLSTSALSRLLHTLYGASSSPELWPQFLVEFSQALKLTGAAILHQDLERENYNAEYAVGVAAEGAPMYQKHYGKLDEWRPGFLETPEGQFVLGDDLCSPSQLKKTEFFNDFLSKHDLRLFGAVATVKRPKQVELVTLYRSWNGKSPGKEAVEAMELIFPHLQSALNLRRKFVDLKARSASLESAIDLVEAGIVLLDVGGHVLQMNRSAEDIFRRNNGLLYRSRGLHASSIRESKQLQSLIDASIKMVNGKGTAPGGSLLISRANSRPLTVTIAPVRELLDPMAARAAAVIFIYDPELEVQPPIDLLRRGYGLTSAEARLALILAAGVSLKEASEMRGVTHNTVRSQLRSIFMKTGVKHQGELVRLLILIHPKSCS